jgi:hypothetical protein
LFQITQCQRFDQFIPAVDNSPVERRAYYLPLCDIYLIGEHMFTYNISVGKDIENKAIPVTVAGIE